MVGNPPNAVLCGLDVNIILVLSLVFPSRVFIFKLHNKPG